eukprot:2479562-Pyramimonas_sp.AAC.1
MRRGTGLTRRRRAIKAVLGLLELLSTPSRRRSGSGCDARRMWRRRSAPASGAKCRCLLGAGAWTLRLRGRVQPSSEACQLAGLDAPSSSVCSQFWQLRPRPTAMTTTRSWRWT